MLDVRCFLKSIFPSAAPLPFAFNSVYSFRVLNISSAARLAVIALAISLTACRPKTENSPAPNPVTTNATWSWWSYAFEAPRPGRYETRLRVDDPAIRTRRLDSGFYARSVTLAR